MLDIPTCNCSEMTEEEIMLTLDDVIFNYKDKPGALIPILQITQRLFGYLPEKALKKIALELDKSYNEVAGVVSFYSFFSTQPRGKYLIRVCLGTACYVRGSKNILNQIEKGFIIQGIVKKAQLRICFHFPYLFDQPVQLIPVYLNRFSRQIFNKTAVKYIPYI